MTKPTLTAPPAPAGRKFQVLVPTGTRAEGGATITTYGYIDATAEQATAYLAGDVNWRSAGATGSTWWGRTWRRISGA